MMLGIGASSSLSKEMADGSAEDMGQNNNFTVLVVDDDLIIRKFHSMCLENFGLRTQVVENGKKAVDLCHVGDTNFDLILMDKEMPVMNGAEATKELRAIGVRSMIFGVTSRDLLFEKKEFMEAGLDFCFGKPLTPGKISFLLQELNKNN